MIAHSFYNLGWRYAWERRQNSISRSLQPGLELGEELCQHSMESDWQGAAIVSLLVCRVQLAKLGPIPTTEGCELSPTSAKVPTAKDLSATVEFLGFCEQEMQ